MAASPDGLVTYSCCSNEVAKLRCTMACMNRIVMNTYIFACIVVPYCKKDEAF